MIDFQQLAIGVLGLAGVVVAGESLMRLGLLHGEYARKSIHIGAGVFLAFLIYYTGRAEIILISGIMFLVTVVLSGYFHSFRALDAVDRWTIGQFLFPISVGLSALIFSDRSVYMFAVLHMALADGFASVVGTAIKHNNPHYHILGGDKSLVGSLTFFLVSVILFVSFLIGVSGEIELVQVPIILGGAALLTATEGFLAGGFDNIGVPLVAGVIASLI